MKLHEVSLRTMWIGLDEEEDMSTLPVVFLIFVLPPSKGSEAYEIWKKLDALRSGKMDAMQYRTDNGMHVVAVGFDLPEDIAVVGFTRKQVEDWAHKNSKQIEAIEIEPDDTSLGLDQLRQLLRKRWDEHNDAQ